MAEPTLTIGIDLGGTNAQIGVVQSGEQLITRLGIKTEAGDGCDAVLDRLAKGVGEVCRSASVEIESISAVGIAAPGAIDMPNGVVLEAPNLGWRNVPVRDLMHRRLGRSIVLDNDVNAAAWGEFRLGAARGRRDCLGVWLGTGVGGGLVLDGRLHHGTLFTAGEFGQQIILPGESSGNQIIEDHCSRTGMSRLIRHWSSEHPDSLIASQNQPTGYITTNAALAEAWTQHDELAMRVVEHAAQLLGISIANAVTLLAIGTVIIGGGVTESLGDPFIKLVRQSFQQFVFPEANRRCELRMTELAADAGLLGAALLAHDAVTKGEPAAQSV